jgi:hypothetical protein
VSPLSQTGIAVHCVFAFAHQIVVQQSVRDEHSTPLGHAA